MSESTMASARPAEGGTATEDATIRPLRVSIRDEEIADLRRRIAATRWPEKETVADRVAGRAVGDDAGARALLGAPTTTSGGSRRG